ncbi:hypothetical protein [Nocardia seriolae]|uniref:hypothetical protein n=1 Tax=Nocardia seriolae TaxID=37332 RepID=UPI0003F43A5C|nr:hypothetical protein [Nocardia seriolae]QOW33875.1 hypothetical protein IMZ23_01545 [Nocardia seriolae]WNJ61076.1 hypothetical protein RMO66_10460 [Nocardia seriolae]BEK97800.1 hypothetical protein NSER024013_57060 [Nocardia seriolae]GEM26290.1 hypothetical protein NS2_45290 [Nocardia seriolae NBRC 15557]
MARLVRNVVAVLGGWPFASYAGGMPQSSVEARPKPVTAWFAYCSAVVAFGLLALTLIAAATGHEGLAAAGGIACALVVLAGIGIFVAVAARDHEHHEAASVRRA